MPTGTIAGVALCRCGHAERLHERDAAVEHDRGVCMHGGCGCAEFRPFVEQSPTAADPQAPESPAVPKSPPLQAVPADRPRTEAMLPCPEHGCEREFSTGHALAIHRSRSHRRHEPESHSASGSISISTLPPEEDVDDEPPTSAPVDPDRLLLELVRILEAVVTADASALVEQALAIRAHITEVCGWVVTDPGGEGE